MRSANRLQKTASWFPMSRMASVGIAAALVAGGAWAGGAEYDVSLGDFPRLRGEADDGARLQRAVDATERGGVLYLPKGEYESSRTIWVTNGVSLLLHKRAYVKATAKMDRLFHLDLSGVGGWRAGKTYDQGLFFRGGHLDGNGLASCLYLNRYFHYTLRDTVFVNGYPYGLHVGPKGCEIIADNLYFRTLKRGLAGNVALYSEGNDSYYSNIVVVDYTVGLKTLGGANAFSHYHVWGGPVPPPAPGRLPEMLENSICFDLGGHMNTVRDSYADTGATGFKVSGWGHQIVGCWFLNNTHFGLKDLTVVRQEPGSADVLVADCCFRGSGEGSKLYEGPGHIRWRDMVYRGFPGGTELPAEIVTGRVCDCATADEWEYAEGLLKFKSAAGEFVASNSCRALDVALPTRLVAKRFPKAGAGEAFVFRIRATDEHTKAVEFSVSHRDGKTWGKIFKIGPNWQELRIPFSELRYFSHWGLPPLKSGEVLDARKMQRARFMYGNWLAGKTVDRPHGFEVSSFRIVGRDR